MSQVVTNNEANTGSPGKVLNTILWLLQIGLELLFLMAGFSKLSGDPQMVGMFDKIGVGQWFRYLTGALEVLGAILLLIPRTSGVGGLLLVGVMMGAILTHLFIVGGSPLVPVVLLVVASAIAWSRRARTANLLFGTR